MLIPDEADADFDAHDAMCGRRLLSADPRCGGSLATYQAWSRRRASRGRPNEREELTAAARVRCFGGDEAYFERYAVMPAALASERSADRPSAAMRDWLSEQHQSERITLTQRDDEWLAGLVAAVRSDVAASHLLSRGESGRIVRLTEFHQRAFGVHERFPWIDIDARTERVIAADLSIVDHWSSYPEQVRNTHRARQVAFERELLALETHIAEDSIIIQHITVEYEPPHLVQVFDFDPKDLDRAKALNAEVFERIMTCTESHKWPTGLGGVRRISSALLDAQTLPDSGSTF